MSFQKYLKYKNKYLSLKNMVGGSTNNLNNNLIYVGYYTKNQNDGSYGGREEEVKVYQYWNTNNNQVQGQTRKMWEHDDNILTSSIGIYKYVGYYTKIQNDGSYGDRDEKEVKVYQYWNTDSNQVQGQTTKMWDHDDGLKIR